MYSIVMLAAMTAAPETPEFCGFFQRIRERRQQKYCGPQNCCPPPYPVAVCPPCPSCGHDHPHHDHHHDGKLPHPKKMGMLPDTQGQMLVTLPADAKVYTDGYLTTETGSVRKFTTPVITPGQDYNYTLKVEYMVNGETRTASRQVTVRGGAVTPVDFTSLSDSKATSAVSVSLPAESKLLIDGVEMNAKAFNTPELAAGKSVTYTFVTETPRDGRTEVESRKVSFKAGEPVVIDFTRKSADSVVSVK